MFNYQAIDKTPTVNQIKAIIKYMEKNPEFEFDLMMDLKRPEPNEIHLDLNDAHRGTTYIVKFKKDGTIISFKNTGIWIS